MTIPDVPAPLIWGGFIVLILILVTIDLRISHNHPEGMTVKRAVNWSIFWILLSVAFGFGVWFFGGGDLAAEYFTGYLLEKTLSVDNLFVFLLIFRQFKVPPALQHRVLTWGILGALVLRAIMILAGIKLIQAWHPIIYIFGGFLIITGIKTMIDKPEEEEGKQSRLMIFAQRYIPFVARYDGERFFTRENGRRVGTLLLIVLVVIEGTDVVFAVDSIPAILAVTNDPFIVFSSNILAILGLRALFFTIAALLERLRYLHYGLGIVLVLIGAKMCASDFVKVPPLISFAVTCGIIGITVVASMMATRRENRRNGGG